MPNSSTRRSRWTRRLAPDLARHATALGLTWLSIQTGTALLRSLPWPIGAPLAFFTAMHVEAGIFGLPFLVWLVIGMARRRRSRPGARWSSELLLLPLLAANLLLPLYRMILYGIYGEAVPGSAVARGGLSAAYLIHLATGYAIFPLSAWMLGRALLRRRGDRAALYGFGASAGRTLGWLVLCVGAFCAMWLYHREPERRFLAELRSAPGEFHPSAARTLSGRTEPLLAIVGDPLACSSQECHGSIFDDWYSSAHRQSATNPAYQRVVELAAADGGIEAVKLCAGCHDPVSLLSGRLAESGGPLTDVSRHGVSCQICHRARLPGEDVEVGNASYVYDPARLVPYEVQSALDIGRYGLTLPPGTIPDIEGLTWATNLVAPMAYTHTRRHTAIQRLPELGRSELCGACHRAVVPRELGGWFEGIAVDEFSSWHDGPYRAGAAGFPERGCVDCHMPQVEANRDGYQGAEDTGGDPFPEHHFATSNATLAARNRDVDQLERVRARASDGHIDLELRPPPEGTTGSLVRVEVAITNRGVGHVFPGGVTDLSELWLTAVVRDGGGATIAQAGGPRADGRLPSEARLFPVHLEGENGETYGRHEIWRGAKRGDPGLTPGESRLVSLEIGLPRAPGDYDLEVALQFRKWSAEFAAWVNERSPGARAPVLRLASARAPLRVRPATD